MSEHGFELHRSDIFLFSDNYMTGRIKKIQSRSIGIGLLDYYEFAAPEELYCADVQFLTELPNRGDINHLSLTSWELKNEIAGIHAIKCSFLKSTDISLRCFTAKKVKFI